jgi:2-dehydropantoate 2-reductase
MHIAIFGAGSVGGYVGGRMAKAGADVTLVDNWPAHVEAIRANGLKISDTEGESVVKVNALHLNDIHQLLKNPLDVAMICLKSYDTAWTTTLVTDYLAPQGVVVSMQNGVNEDTIAKIVGWDRVLGCVLNTIGCEMIGPGHAHRWMKPAPAGYAVFRVGEVHGQKTKRAQAIAEVYGKVDNAEVTQNIWGERWTKLINNAMQSGIAPLTGLGTLDMLGDPELKALSVATVQEGIRVAQAAGLQLQKICGIEPDIWLSTTAEGAQTLEAGLAEFSKRLSRDGQASTLHDIRRGRRTEIEWINGLIARKSLEVGVPAPLNTEQTELVKKLERGEIKQGRHTLDHLLGKAKARAA